MFGAFFYLGACASVPPMFFPLNLKWRSFAVFPPFQSFNCRAFYC